MQFVAVKIIQAKASAGESTEVSICNHLAEKAKQDSHSKHVTTFLDNFRLTGPNGDHTCLVFEPMGPSAASMVDELPYNQPRAPGKISRYPEPMAKSILRQVLRALAFSHRNGVSHGDLQPGNILFAVSDLTCASEEKLLQDLDSTTQALHRLDGEDDAWAPRYLALGQSLHAFVKVDSSATVKLSDFGAGKSLEICREAANHD